MKRKTTEEYLEIIYVLQKRDGFAKTGKISKEYDITPPSVTEMLQKLQKEGYVEYTKYRGARLTEPGLRIARKLMETHRIIADFLEIIGVEREMAEIDACQLEHHVSIKTMKRLKDFVDFINGAPDRPRWIDHYHDYIRTGKRQECSLFGAQDGRRPL